MVGSIRRQTYQSMRFCSLHLDYNTEDLLLERP